MEVSGEEKESSLAILDENKSMSMLEDLDLTLSCKRKEKEPNRNLDLFGSSSEGSLIPVSESRVYYCNYCGKKFNNSQALGGHQNAHKYERTLAKKRSGMKFPMVGHYPPSQNFPPYLTMHGYPPHLTRPNSSLGVQMHSKIHKPIHPWAYIDPQYMHGSWERLGFFPNQEVAPIPPDYYHANHVMGGMLGYTPSATSFNLGENNIIPDPMFGVVGSGSEVSNEGSDLPKNPNLEESARPVDTSLGVAISDVGRNIPPKESRKGKEVKIDEESGVDLVLKL